MPQSLALALICPINLSIPAVYVALRRLSIQSIHFVVAYSMRSCLLECPNLSMPQSINPVASQINLSPADVAPHQAPHQRACTSFQFLISESAHIQRDHHRALGRVKLKTMF